MSAILNYCTTCRKDFASLAAFDTHRVGTFAYMFAEGTRLDPPRFDGRRCLDESEFAEHGLALDDRGRWCLVRRVEHARRYWGAVEDAQTAAGTPSTI